VRKILVKTGRQKGVGLREILIGAKLDPTSAAKREVRNDSDRDRPFGHD